ncbi:phosphatidylserine decarboxylase family protein, partial [bacterium]|nr:phosphatidylserine decarboxylase family protein [bacterium]
MERKLIPYRVGKWLSSDQDFLDNWLKSILKNVEQKPKKLHPIIQDFKKLIETDPEIYMFFDLMFSQLPKHGKFTKNPAGGPQIRNYHQMLQVFNEIMTSAPEFNKTGLVGFPINAVLDWSMGTQAGYAAFLNDKINAMFKKMLNQWAVYLGSKDSCKVLNSNPRTGWFGKDAKEAMPTFEKDFICDPTKKFHGFKSWDDFFTREFRKGKRPVAEPNDDSVIVNACESAPYRISKNVKRRAKFWIKGQPYSLEHMLNGDSYIDKFVGGTVYQAFLSALAYHRWHSPVSGTIVKAYVIDGSYYSESPAEGYDPSGPNESQGYITAVATRALIFIKADNPDIGLMCFMPVGMAEVSTCDITVYEGQHVNKGDQLGMFHFGRSTHCLFFGPHVKLEFDLHGQKPGLDSGN